MSEIRIARPYSANVQAQMSRIAQAEEVPFCDIGQIQEKVRQTPECAPRFAGRRWRMFASCGWSRHTLWGPAETMNKDDGSCLPIIAECHQFGEQGWTHFGIPLLSKPTTSVPGYPSMALRDRQPLMFCVR